MNASRYAALFLFVALPAFAGNPQPYSWKFGVHAGANFSTAMIDPDITAQGGTKKGRTDVVGGLSAEVGLCDRLAIRTEANYMQYGYKFEDSQTIGTIRYSQIEDIRVNYLEVPITGEYDFTQGELEFGLFFGTIFGFRFCSEEEFTSTFGTQQQSGKQDIRDRTSKFHFGITGGVGAEYRLGSQLGLRLDGRYNLGLTNIYTNPPNFTPPANYTEPKIKYRSLNLNLGLTYRIE